MKIKRPLRVCHISTLTGWGGVERMLIDLLTSESSNNIHHMLLTPSSKPELLVQINEANISHYEPKRRWRYDPLPIWHMARWLRQSQVDVVHAYNAYANVWGYLAALFAHIPLFISGEHGTLLGISNTPMSLFDRWAQTHATAVVANSQASATILHRKYHIPPEKIHVVANAVAPLPQVDIKKVREQFGIPLSACLVGSVGRLAGPKNFITFLEAANYICQQRRDVYFMLIGGGPQERLLRDYIQAKQIADRFILTGERSDARCLIQAFDLFVSTSLQESFGNVLVEAALAAVPVVAPAVGGITDVIINQQTGVLLEPTQPIVDDDAVDAKIPYKEVLIGDQLLPPRALDAKQLADVILKLLASPEERHQLGEAAYQRAIHLFTIDRYRQDLERIYMQVTKMVAKE